MVFVPAMTTFVLLSDLLGGSILLIGNVIEQQFKQVNNWHMGSGLSLVLMIFIAISMAIMNKYDKEERGVILNENTEKVCSNIYLVFIFVLCTRPS